MKLSIVILASFLSGTLAYKNFHLGRRVGGNVLEPNVEITRAAPFQGWFTQNLDHFNPTDNRTWQQKFLINDDLYQEGGPAFLYISGESSASTSWLQYGSMVEYAEKYHAIIYELEHRYYGTSRPTEDLSPDNLKFLTSQQALADLAVFVEAVNANFTTPIQWIAFGGSYAGALAAWLRNKYPHLIQGAVSHSGPILAQVNFENYLRVVGESLSAYDEQCTAVVKEAFAQIEASLKSTTGLATLNELFELCEPIQNFIDNEDAIATFFESLADSFAGVVQYDDNGRSIKSVCDDLTDETAGSELERLKNFAQDYTYSGCLDYNYQELVGYYKNASWDSGASEGGLQWTYQTCTEFGYYQTSTYPTHVFGENITLDYFIHQCEDIFDTNFDGKFLDGVVERTNTLYGGLDIKVSNVVYVHGSTDPWHALGIIETIDTQAPAFYVKGVSHCAGMYERDDSIPEMVRVINQVDELIGGWLGQEQ